MSEQKGFTLWFTGLSGSGKTALAKVLEPALRERGLKVERLDGDIVRQSLTRDLGFSKEDRDKNIERVTFVAKLLNLVRPDVAVFGRKDAQQCLVIDQMVQDLKMPVALVDAPTVREGDGLAMSSRNRYLDAARREQSLCLYRALTAGRGLLDPMPEWVAEQIEMQSGPRLASISSFRPREIAIFTLGRRSVVSTRP